MPDPNFLNVHVLISHSPSCLNRDDMNMQKSAVFGGVRRVRISSQSLKRAIRQSDYYKQHLGMPSLRTRSLDMLMADLVPRLVAKGIDEDLARRTIEMIVKDPPKDTKAKGKAKGAKAQPDAEPEEASDETPAKEKELAVAPWSVDEVAEYCTVVRDGEASGADFKALKKRVSERGASLLAALDTTVDIALSGRMATSGLMTKVDAAAAIAHAITTHAVDADVDWFTAVDDLVVETGESGAGHLNTQEFGAGVFYRYASLNIGQLQKNLGDATRQRALEVAAHLVHMLATVVPEAKQNSFAAFNPADLVYVTFSDLPLSGANAFETPVERDRIKKTGLLKPSIDAFDEHVSQVERAYAEAYGLSDRRAVFSIWDTSLAPKFSNLSDFEAWIRADGSSAGAGGV